MPKTSKQIKEYSKNWYKKNKDRQLAKSKEYYQENHEERKVYRENNPDKIKERFKKYYEENKEKLKARRREYYRNNKEKLNASNKEWEKKNPERRKNKYLERLYGITLEQYNETLDKQEGKCGICETHQSNFKRDLSVDHCHKTGNIRGLLCDSCNIALGNFKDNPDILKKALKYLIHHNQK